VASGPVIRLAVFGNPVTQSLSPRIHGLFAEQCGLKVDYQAIEASKESFPELTRALALQGGRGCNITAPFKNAAWQLAHRSSDSARRAQAANTLVFESETDWYADSTDGKGLVNDLLSTTSLKMAGLRICLLGAGGAAASVLAALLRAQPEAVVIANRSLDRANQLAKTHSDLGIVEVCTPDALPTRAPFDLIINATSLGHSGESPGLESSWLNPGALCYDMNYGPAAEPLRRSCMDKGIKYSDGLGMLVGQAALSFQLWTGKIPDASAVLCHLRGTPG
jgi:shikimate dehydrogenase